MADDTFDYGWVMEMTFVITVVVGAPIIALASLTVELESWTTRVVFATTIAAGVWFITAVSVFLFAVVRRRRGAAEQ